MSNIQNLREQVIQKAWEDEAFKQQLLTNPKAALKEAFGIEVPDSIELEVVEDSSNKLHLVIPPNPAEIKEENNVEAPMWL